MIPEVGILTLYGWDRVALGQWGWIRLSSAVERSDLERVLEVCEKIGAKLYDESRAEYLTQHSLDQILVHLSANP